MEKLYSKTLGSHVVEDGLRPITTVQDMIFDPDNGKVVAFVVSASEGLIVLPMDIESWNDFVKIGSHNDIVEAEDIIKVQDVLKQNRGFVGNKVESRDGQFIGNVYDLGINNKSMLIEKLFVGKGILGLIKYDMRIIPYSQIFEVKEDKIIIKDSIEKVKESEAARVNMEGAIG